MMYEDFFADRIASLRGKKMCQPEKWVYPLGKTVVILTA